MEWKLTHGKSRVRTSFELQRWNNYYKIAGLYCWPQSVPAANNPREFEQAQPASQLLFWEMEAFSILSDFLPGSGILYYLGEYFEEVRLLRDARHAHGFAIGQNTSSIHVLQARRIEKEIKKIFQEKSMSSKIIGQVRFVGQNRIFRHQQFRVSSVGKNREPISGTCTEGGVFPLFVSFFKEPVCFFVPDKMKVARPKPRTALRRCPAPGSEMTHRRLSNAWAAEKTMPTEHWTTPELLTGRIQKRCNSWVKGLTKIWCLHAHVNWTALGRKKRLQCSRASWPMVRTKLYDKRSKLTQNFPLSRTCE